MYVFYRTCVDWPEGDVHADGGLCDMIDQATDISRRTFLKHAQDKSRRELERDLGYEDHPKRGLTMAGDYHVSYHRSTLHGERVYFFKWSAIEHVFVKV